MKLINSTSPSHTSGNSKYLGTLIGQIYSGHDLGWSHLILSLVSSGLMLLAVNNYLQRRHLAQRIQCKRREVANGVELIKKRVNSCELSSKELLAIASLSLGALKYKLRSRELSPLTVLRAFQAKALQLYDQGNSGICQFITEAEDQLVDLDDQLDQLLDNSPLAGIPVSVKESCSLKGYDSVYGLGKRCGRPCKSDCILVQTLKARGSIPFVVTIGSFCASDMLGFNPVFDELSNPHNPKHCPGGSTTGECVLIAQHGSLIGLGNDRIGSIRVPAVGCGVLALRSTPARLSMRETAAGLDSTIMGISMVYGPLASSVDTLVDFMRTILSEKQFDLDHRVVPMPFNETVFNSKSRLKIGICYTLKHDKLTQSTPSVRGVLQKSVHLLQKHGHQIVEFNPPRIGHVRDLLNRCIFAGGGVELIKLISYETLAKPCFTKRLITSLPVPMAQLVAFIYTLFGALLSGDLKRIVYSCRTISVFDLLEQIEAYKKEFIQAWYQTGIDVLICPGLPHPAPPKWFNLELLNNAVIHSGLYNMVDYPTGILPMGFVDNNQGQLQAAVNRNQMNPNQLDELCSGLPLAIQVVAPPYREELLLRLMRELESANMEKN